MIRTLSPSKPRMIGRLVPGPNVRLAIPGSFCNTSAIVAPSRLAIAVESTVVIELKDSNAVLAPVALAVTVMASCTPIVSETSTVTVWPSCDCD